MSLSLAYVALAFLAACLSLGPWILLNRRFVPMSFGVRRDVGIWAGILALLHTAVGLNVHLRGRMWLYFVKQFWPPLPQIGMFGFANYIGLAAAVLFVILLAISNDRALRRLGLHRWKRWQRWTYVAAGLTVFHALAYWFVEKRAPEWMICFAALAGTALVLQLAGFLRLRTYGARPGRGTMDSPDCAANSPHEGDLAVVSSPQRSWPW